MVKNGRKILGIVLSFSVTVTSAFGYGIQQKWQVNAAEAEKDTIVTYVAVEGKNASGTAVSVEKTPVYLEEGSVATDAIKEVLEQSEYKDNYTISNGPWGDSLDQIGGLTLEQAGDDYYYWSFNINNSYATVGIGSYELKDQDKISLIYTYDNHKTQASCYEDDVNLNPGTEECVKIVEQAVEERNILALHIFEETFQNGAFVPGLGANSNAYYTIYSLKQAGLEVPEFYEAVYKKLENDLKLLEAGETIVDEATETQVDMKYIMESGYASPYFAKIVLAVTEMGYDATNVGGVNLIEKLVNKQVYNASTTAISNDAYGCEGMILMAIDRGNYDLPQGEQYLTRAELVNEVLSDVKNSVSNSLLWKSYDGAAMSIQALAPYMEKVIEGVEQKKVVSTCNQVLNLLGTMQSATGLYGDEWTPNNPWTLAQIMYTAGLFDINILSEENGDFIKNGVTLFHNASHFVNVQTGKVEASLSFQPEQLLRGYNQTIQTAIADGVNAVNTTTGCAVTVNPTQKPSTTETPSSPETEIPVATETPNVSVTQTPSQAVTPGNTATGGAVTPEAVNVGTKNIADAKVSSVKKQIYTGKKICPNVTLTYEGITLEKDKDYQVSYKKNKALGTGKIVLTGIGQYTGTKEISFSIVLGTGKITKVKGNKISFRKVTGGKKYRVQISTNKKFKKNVVTKTTKKTCITYSFKNGKKYYIRVQAVNGKKTGAYSKHVCN